MNLLFNIFMMVENEPIDRTWINWILPIMCDIRSLYHAYHLAQIKLFHVSIKYLKKTNLIFMVFLPQSPRHSKLEKADILEMTVKYLRSVHGRHVAGKSYSPSWIKRSDQIESWYFLWWQWVHFEALIWGNTVNFLRKNCQSFPFGVIPLKHIHT